MSAPRRWARRAVLSVLAGGTAGLGTPLPGAALGAEASAGTAGGGAEGTTTQPTATTPQAPDPAQGAGGAGETSTTTSTTSAPASTTPSAPAAPPSPAAAPSAGPPTEPSGASTTPAASAPPAAPTVVVQSRQQATPGVRANATATGTGAQGTGGSGGASAATGKGAGQSAPGAATAGGPNGVAPAPQVAGGEAATLATLLAGSVVSAQALDFYRIPLFLLPIYKAAAFQYDVPWQVLAAINEVETDYGSDLSLSTAGAVGWMQFMPATWLRYGVDATYAGYADPYNPADAVFAAARYLHAAGAAHNLDAAIFAYNHSQAYVESVVLRARLIASFPRSVIETLTGLAAGRAPTAGARALTPAGPAAAGSASATAGATPLGFAPAPGAAVGAGTTAAGATGAAGTGAAAGTTGTGTPGTTPAPSPQVAARRARAAANSPAQASQLVELLGAPDARVVAVQDGRIVHLGRSHELGRYLVLRDVYGDVFTYAGLGSIAPRYRPTPPALARDAVRSTKSHDPAPTLPASAGHQRLVTLRVKAPATRAPAAGRSAAAGAAGEGVRATAPAGTGRVRLFAHPDNPLARAAAAHRAAGAGSAGGGRWLKLQTGAVVSVGTVLGHLYTPAGATVGRMRFAVRPAGDGGTIDPRPLLADWRQLGMAVHPKGSRSTGALLGATAGDALTMSKGQLARAVLADPGIQLDACGRRDVTAGAVDARVLAALVFLSRSGLQPTATLRCPRGTGRATGRGALASAARVGGPVTEVEVTALNGVPLAGHQGAGTIADAAIRTLLALRGRDAPHRIVSLERYPQDPSTQATPLAWGHIGIDFPPPPPAVARAAAAAAHAATAGPAAASPLAVAGGLNGTQWDALAARLAALPQPVVAAGPSTAAIRDPQAAPTNRGLGTGG